MSQLDSLISEEFDGATRGIGRGIQREVVSSNKEESNKGGLGLTAISLEAFEEVKEVKKKQMTIYASVELSDKIKTVAMAKNQNASRVVESVLEEVFASITVNQDKVNEYDEKYRKGKGRK